MTVGDWDHKDRGDGGTHGEKLRESGDRTDTRRWWVPDRDGTDGKSVLRVPGITSEEEKTHPEHESQNTGTRIGRLDAGVLPGAAKEVSYGREIKLVS